MICINLQIYIDVSHCTEILKIMGLSFSKLSFIVTSVYMLLHSSDVYKK